MMKLKLFVLAILFVTVSLLILPDLTHTPVLGQADKSFKGTFAPFVPPSSSERLGSLPGNNFEFDDEEVEADEEEEEIDRDDLPVLTKQERDEFLSDNIDAIEPDRLTALSQEETIDDDIDPISSVVEEIVKNETIIGDEEFVPSPDSSIIKFKDENLEQILDAQEVAPEPDNQTISTSEEEELPLNVTEDDFEIEQADEISESESPDVDVQSFINETANGEATAPTDNKTAITTEDAVEGKPSELLEMDPETEDEIQDIEELQTEQEEEAQTPQGEESPNTVPTAQETSVSTTQNQQLNIKLNANDADEDNLLVTIVDEPSNGQLGNVNPSTNTVTYTPDEDYSGEDNFTFIVNDGTVDSNEATVSITVEEEQQTEQAQQEQEKEAQTPQGEEEAEEDSQEEED
ncbi:MAG: Ig-like domain-containing protein [Nitrososphaeraceae archaeon]